MSRPKPPLPAETSPETPHPLPSAGGAYVLVDGQLVPEAEYLAAPETLPETGA